MVDTFVLEVSVVHNIDVQYRGILQTEGASISMHTAAAPAVRAAVKTSLPYRNDTIRNDTITQSLSYLTCWTSCDRVAMPDARDPFLAPNQKLGDKKMFHIFHFFKSDMAFTIIDPFLWKANVIFRKSCSITMPFLLTHIDVRAVKIFPLAESWLVIQISGGQNQMVNSARFSSISQELVAMSRNQFDPCMPLMWLSSDRNSHLLWFASRLA